MLKILEEATVEAPAEPASSPRVEDIMSPRGQVVRRHRILLIVLGLIVALLVVARLTLPGYISRTVNEQIAQTPDVEGGIEAVRLALLRGAYRIEGLELSHRPQGQEVLHATAESVSLQVSWSSLFRGRLVGSVRVERPEIHTLYVKEDVLPEEDQVDLAEQLQSLFPFRIDSVTVRDGTMSFRTPEIAPADALMLENVNVEVRNITNMTQVADSSFATFDVEGQAEGSAPLKIEGRLDPTAETPTFDFNISLKKLRFVELNPWLAEYVNAKAEAGTFETYAELAAAEGKFEGYVRPHALDLEITSVEDSNLLEEMWAGVVDFVSGVLENEEEDQGAARIPVKGSIDDPEVGVLPTIMSTLRNAFVAAFARSLEGSISIEKLKAEEGEGD